MALSISERQKHYREQIERGELVRFQVVLPLLETGIKADCLCHALGRNKTELFSRLLMEEWERQGRPTLSGCV